VVGVVLGVVGQLVLDLALVLGVPSVGLPPLGVVGAGLAHVLTSTLRLVVVVIAAESLLADGFDVVASRPRRAAPSPSCSASGQPCS